MPPAFETLCLATGILLGMSFLKHLDFSQQGNTLTLSYPQTR